MKLGNKVQQTVYGIIGSALLLLMIAGYICIVVSPSGAPQPTPPLPTAQRVIFVVVDTLRADHLTPYGYVEHPTSPFLQKLADESIVFDKFYAASPWTAPSFATMLTGVGPMVHEAGQFAPKTGKKIRGVSLSPINSNLVPLAEVLQLAGIATAAITSTPFLHPILGFKRGFDHYDLEFEKRDGKRITRKAIKWLSDHGDTNFFLLVHYFDPHAPYREHDYLKQAFYPDEYARIETPFKKNDREVHQMQLTSDELRQVVGLYDGEINYVDRELRRLYSHMEREGMLDDTWLVVVSDHGEELQDHGGFYHAKQFWDEVVRVPLLIRPPGGEWQAGKRVRYSASHRDLMPTILEWYALDGPPYLPGESLMPLMSGQSREHRPAMIERPLTRRQNYAFFDGQYKLIMNSQNLGVFLGNHRVDPLEKHNRIGDRQLYARIRKKALRFKMEEVQLYRQLQARGQKKDDENDPNIIPKQMEETLKNLGYIQ